MPVGVMCGGDKSEVLHNGLEWVSGQYPWIQGNLDGGGPIYIILQVAFHACVNSAMSAK